MYMIMIAFEVSWGALCPTIPPNKTPPHPHMQANESLPKPLWLLQKEKNFPVSVGLFYDVVSDSHHHGYSHLLTFPL
ncbi:hypothetical protein QVD17_25956 [Tagetes erecta]|uniref:Uncharacterized protein n=1 Tax=Tagetes erecta TaxID=13708 RepID=A0AAD8NPM3_TARER|nr:hypothetical protein QVD17_25956 [Tagetes erecta]